jgi:uncharacterized protein (TIGR03435 family)
MRMTTVFGVKERVRLLVATGVIAAGAMAHAQSVPAKTLKFEVATIKPISQSGMHMVSLKVSPGGRVTLQTQSLKSLICIAFDVSGWQVSGGDAELNKKYDVQAEAPELVAPNTYNDRATNLAIADERLRQMLQALLIDRFQLKFRRETKEGTVYLLERNGKTLQLHASQVAKASPYPSGDIGASSGRGWMLHDTSMPELASYLSVVLLHKPVQDRTGVEGAFDFESKTILTDADFHAPGLMETFLPVIGEMGLKLETSKGPVESFVVEHVEAPTEN